MLISLIAAASISAAKPMTDPCRDDRGGNRCAAAEQQRMRALYRVEPITAFASGTSRRLFFVDGYGNDTIAIHFQRPPGQDPIVTVNFPKVPGEAPIAPLKATLTADQWTNMIDASQYFDRSFAPPKRNSANNDEDVVICIHSWVYWGEATDPGKTARSVTQDSCNDAPIKQFAWTAVKLARSVFPHCAMLDPQFSRNDATLLRACEGLTGDRIAAAEVFNRGEAFRRIGSSDPDGGIDRFSAWELVINYQGRETKGRDAEKLWRSLFVAKDHPNFYYDWIKGIDAETVIVSGGLYLTGAVEGKDQIAPVELRWEKEADRFDLTSITIGPYQPFTPASE